MGHSRGFVAALFEVQISGVRSDQSVSGMLLPVLADIVGLEMIP